MSIVEEPALFDVYEQTSRATTTDAPICPTCRIHPRKWGPRLNDWARFCNGASCDSDTRRCKRPECGKTYSRNEGGTKYCSTECMIAANTLRRGITVHTCANEWCGGQAQTDRKSPSGWIDNRCRDCWHGLVDDRHRLRSWKRHNVTWAMATTWANRDWECPSCLRYIAVHQGHIHHDHECCPGETSCGACIIDYVCGTCNTGAGMLGDDPQTLRRMADLIERGPLPTQ